MCSDHSNLSTQLQSAKVFQSWLDIFFFHRIRHWVSEQIKKQVALASSSSAGVVKVRNTGGSLALVAEIALALFVVRLLL
jgi:hypothetical protein